MRNWGSRGTTRSISATKTFTFDKLHIAIAYTFVSDVNIECVDLHGDNRHVGTSRCATIILDNLIIRKSNDKDSQRY